MPSGSSVKRRRATPSSGKVRVGRGGGAVRRHPAPTTPASHVTSTATPTSKSPVLTSDPLIPSRKDHNHAPTATTYELASAASAKTVERAATVARRRPSGDGAWSLDLQALASEVGGTGTRARSLVNAHEQRPRLGSSSACSFQRATGTSSAPAEKSRRASASSGTGASS